MRCDEDATGVVQTRCDQPGVGGMQGTATQQDQEIQLPFRQDKVEATR